MWKAKAGNMFFLIEADQTKVCNINGEDSPNESENY